MRPPHEERGLGAATRTASHINWLCHQGAPMLSIDTLRTVSALTGIFSSVSQIVIAATALQGVNAYVAQAEVRAQRLSAIQDRFNDSVKAITPYAGPIAPQHQHAKPPKAAIPAGAHAQPPNPPPAAKAKPKAAGADKPAKADVEPVATQGWGDWAGGLGGRLFGPAGTDPMKIAAEGGEARAKAQASAAALAPLGAK